MEEDSSVQTLDHPFVSWTVALGIGLLIGIERERRKGEGPRRAAAGLRTFAITSFLGARAMETGGALLLSEAAAGVMLLRDFYLTQPSPVLCCQRSQLSSKYQFWPVPLSPATLIALAMPLSFAGLAAIGYGRSGNGRRASSFNRVPWLPARRFQRRPFRRSPISTR
ncbi:MAG: MgtC/SapB family protein [Hyphomicrobiaceae bacterium]